MFLTAREEWRKENTGTANGKAPWSLWLMESVKVWMALTNPNRKVRDMVDVFLCWRQGMVEETLIATWTRTLAQWRKEHVMRKMKTSCVASLHNGCNAVWAAWMNWLEAQYVIAEHLMMFLAQNHAWCAESERTGMHARPIQEMLVVVVCTRIWMERWSFSPFTWKWPESAFGLHVGAGWLVWRKIWAASPLLIGKLENIYI